MIVPLLLATAVAQTSAPVDYRVALLPVLIDAGPEVTAAAVFRLVSHEAQLRKTLRLMSIDEFFFNDGGSRADGVLACGSDTRCLARQLTPFRADLGLVVIVNGQLDPPLVGVLTLDTRGGRLIAERYEQVAPAEVGPVLARTVGEHLDRAGHPKWGRLEVQPSPAGAMVTLTPSFPPEIGRPHSFVVPPGRYRVRGTMDGYGGAATQARVRAGGTVRVGLSLTEDPAWYESPWVWVGAAIVVAAAVAVPVTIAATSGESVTCGCVITADQPVCPPCP